MTEENASKWEDMAKMEQDQQQEMETALKEEILADENHQDAESMKAASEDELDADLASPADVETIQRNLIEAQNKAEENWQKALRAVAEMENAQRRAERDVEKAHKYGNEKFINSLLPVIDSLEQALQIQAEDDNEAVKSMKQGIELTLKLFADSLEKANVKQINPVDEPFNPQQHEAMSMQPAPDKAPNTVLVVFQKGYLLNDRVIRPARVIVSN